IAGELFFRETPEAEHLVNQQSGGDVAMVDHHHPGIARDRSRTAAEELAQIDDREKLAAHVSEPLDPRLGARHTRHASRYTEHFARLLTRDQVEISRHS